MHERFITPLRCVLNDKQVSLSFRRRRNLFGKREILHFAIATFRMTNRFPCHSDEGGIPLVHERFITALRCVLNDRQAPCHSD